jgi:hypothetical protein
MHRGFESHHTLFFRSVGVNILVFKTNDIGSSPIEVDDALPWLVLNG